MSKKQQLLKELLRENLTLKNTIEESTKQLEENTAKLALLQKQVDTEKRDPLDMVTAHAIVRYLERTCELDVNSLKRQIVGGHEATIRNFVTCKIETINGTLVVKDGYIVTIL